MLDPDLKVQRKIFKLYLRKSGYRQIPVYLRNINKHNAPEQSAPGHCVFLFRPHE